MHADVIFYKKSVDGIIWIFSCKESAEKSKHETFDILLKKDNFSKFLFSTL